MNQCDYMKEAWFALLAKEVDASNKTRVADKMGINRATLSAVFNGIGEYGKGTASTKRFEILFRNTFNLFPCSYTGENVGATICRERALIPAPIHNPNAMHQWKACQECDNKPRPPKEQVVAKGVKPSTFGRLSGGKATSGEEAYQEGWDCIGGSMDNPYLVEDSRSDYWRTGYEHRKAFDLKQRDRFAKPLPDAPVEKPQQAGIVDKVTLPLPEVGPPQPSAFGPVETKFKE